MPFPIASICLSAVNKSWLFYAGNVADSDGFVSSVDANLPTVSEQVWKLTDLQILHELRVPVCVTIPHIVESERRLILRSSQPKDPCTITRATVVSFAVRGELRTQRSASSKVQSS